MKYKDVSSQRMAFFPFYNTKEKYFTALKLKKICQIQRFYSINCSDIITAINDNNREEKKKLIVLENQADLSFNSIRFEQCQPTNRFIE